MINRVRAFDWATTPVGPIEGWPSILKHTVATLLHSRHPMFLWWGPDLIQFYNDAYVPSFGRGKHPRSLGQSGPDCWPEIWPLIGPQVEGVMRDGQATWHEDQLVPIHRNGALEDVFWTYGYSPVIDEHGMILGTLVVCTETTGRIAKAQAAQKQQALLNEVFQRVPAGVCIFSGPDLTFEFANTEYQRIVGRSDLIGRSLLSAIPELAGQGFDDLLRLVMRTGEPYSGHEAMTRLDRNGSIGERYYTFRYSPLLDDQRQIRGVIAFVIDVTEHVEKRVEAEHLAEDLRQSKDEFQLLAETIPQLAWSARPDGHVDWYNRRWYEYTGTDLEQLQGWGWKSVHDPKVVDDVILAWSHALAAGEPFEMQFPLRRRDGLFRWHLTRAVPLRASDGTIVRWFGTNTDVDDSRRAAEERAVLLASERQARLMAESASHAKDEFLATASHELRTPLNAILGWSRMLAAGNVAPADIQNACERIQRNAEAQVRLIDDLLDASRVITGKLHLEIAAMDLAGVVGAALDVLRPAAAAKGIQLLQAVDPRTAAITGDADRLQQVVWNLVNNAIKFTPRGGEVRVALRRLEEDVQLAVSDTGQGIDSAFLPHVFERFRQAEDGSSRRHGGLGLGLALVRHLVEAHGGTVSVKSEGVGRGAEFTVTLPTQAAPPPSNPPPRRVEHDGDPPMDLVSLAGSQILIVDDEEDARVLVSAFLRKRGADVTVVSDAESALAALQASRYAAVVTDVGMAGVDGYELVRRIRAQGSPLAQVPVIALTAYAREEDRRLALAAGFSEHLIKPVDPDQLCRVTAELIGRAKA